VRNKLVPGTECKCKKYGTSSKRFLEKLTAKISLQFGISKNFVAKEEIESEEKNIHIVSFVRKFGWV